MFGKVLVANRGEIAVRAFRAAYELGVRTVAVVPYEDRNAIHRIKADEAYLIGERGHPVRAYLDINEIMRAAKESDADAIYPGYGFLSENPELASACAQAGITFIGPPTRVLELAGNKVRAIEAARAAGVPTLRSTPPSADLDELMVGAEAIGFPVFVKAVAGGGGRGMRRIERAEQLGDSISAACAKLRAFGDPTAFIEQAVGRPRHIEVQVLADTQGETIHLFERDCRCTASPEDRRDCAGSAHLDRLREAVPRAARFAESIDYLLRRHG
jgi:pyruvate carboxylase